MSQYTRKPGFKICHQERFSLSSSDTDSFYNLKILAGISIIKILSLQRTKTMYEVSGIHGGGGGGGGGGLHS